MGAQIKKSRLVKSVYQCQTCGTETEVVNSDVPPTACLQCGMGDLKQTAKMEVSTTVTVVQLPFPKG